MGGRQQQPTQDELWVIDRREMMVMRRGRDRKAEQMDDTELPL